MAAALTPPPRVLVLATTEGDLLRESHVSHRLEVAGFEVHLVSDPTEVHTLVVSLDIELVRGGCCVWVRCPWGVEAARVRRLSLCPCGHKGWSW